MSLPGFTAEASLYRTETNYYMSGSAAVETGGQSVLAQFCYRVGQYFCCWWPYTGFVCRRIPVVQALPPEF